ncbi:hypothetical protein Mbo2_085 [Rhodococcus phage Mbo2]|uniref:VWFA domain-containing protein n=1 Tax=Rhodococcus phage Mbo2 TaxID=2936911 RepID=A0A9E7LF39_9CAUD|nr:hypothetical protein Mbo2_085 [Rhodococcus phage Mbo2]
MTDTVTRAAEAVREMRKRLPQLTSFVRALTDKPDINVEIGSITETDGRTVWIRPPLALADKSEHDRRLCDDRDEDGALLCPACRRSEEIYVNIFHELGHMTFGSLDKLGAQELSAAAVAGSRFGTDAFQEFVRAQCARYLGRKGFAMASMDFADVISPYLAPFVLAMEDARVDALSGEKRPGVEEMRWHQTEIILSRGNENSDGTYSRWSDAPLEVQLPIAALVFRQGHLLPGRFSDDACKAVRYPEVSKALMLSLSSPTAAFTAAVALLGAFNRLGLYDLPLPEEKPDQAEPENGPGDENADETSDPEGSEENQSNGGSDQESGDDTDSDAGSESDSGGDNSAADEESSDVPEEGSSGEPEIPDGDENTPDGDDSGSDGDSPEDQGDVDDDGSGTGGASGAGDGDRSSDSAPPDEEAGDGGEGAPDSEGEGQGNEGEAREGDGEVDDQSDGSDGAGGSAGTGGDPDHAEGAPAGDGAAADDADAQDDPDRPDADGADGGDAPADADGGGDDVHDAPDAGVDTGGDGERTGGQDVPADQGEPEQDPASDPVETDPTQTDEITADDLDLTFEHQSPEDIAAAMDQVSGHAHGEELNGDATRKEMENAIGQATHFDEISEKIHGINIFKDGQGLAWGNRVAGRNAKAPHVPVPESVISGSVMRARKVFSDSKLDKHERNLRSGKLNGAVLGKRAALGDDRLFKRRHRAEGVSWEVVIGMDVSGSTDDGAIYIIKKSAEAMANVLHRVGIPFSVYAHTTGLEIGRMSLDLYSVKDPRGPWSDQQKAALAGLYATGGSLDGHNMEFYRKILDRSTARRKLILYFTDGEIPASNPVEELQVMQRELKLIRARKYDVLAVGVGTESPKKFGLDTVAIRDGHDIVTLVKALEKRLTGNL